MPKYALEIENRSTKYITVETEAPCFNDAMRQSFELLKQFPADHPIWKDKIAVKEIFSDAKEVENVG